MGIVLETKVWTRHLPALQKMSASTSPALGLQTCDTHSQVFILCDKPFTRGAISYTNSSAKIVFYCLGTKSDCNCNRVFSVPVPCATVLAGAMNWLAWCWEVDLLSVQSHHQAIAAAPGGSLNWDFRKITNRRKQLLEMMFF